jgi:hypothetical protein
MADTSVGTLSYTAGANSGVIVGKFARWFSAGINPAPVLFPVGDVNTNATPRMLTIQFTNAPTTGGTLTAQYITGDPGNNGTGPLSDGVYTVDTYSHTGYWQVDANLITGGNYNISISPIGFLGMFLFSELRVLKRADALSLWILDGTQVSGDATPKANRSGLTGFSQFALGGNTIDNPLDGPLPVEISTFTSNISGRDVNLNWTTASEHNNSGFEIQKQFLEPGNKSSDWAKIGFLNGSGTKNSPTNYTFQDKGLNTGKFKYRLKQIDYNGNFEFFNLNNDVIIGTPNKFDVSQNYPNPFNPVTKIDYNLPFDSKVIIKIYDIIGREMKSLVNEEKQAGYYSVDFNGTDFASGMYFYRITAEGNGQKFVMIKKMLMLK